MSEPLRRVVRVFSSIAHTFEVFTSRIDSWWPPGHRRLSRSTLRLEAFEGGRFFERSAEGEEFELGKVLSCDSPNQISFSWNLGAIQLPTLVEISFTQDAGDTIVEIVHSEADSRLGKEWPGRVALFAKGWEHVIVAFISAISADPGESAAQD